jgi:PASTA domain-containing protein
MALTRQRLCARVVPALLLTALAGLTLASAASAKCHSSTPNSIGLADSPSDGGLAPEITVVTVAVNATCGYLVDLGIAKPLVADDSVSVYVNVDGDPATGDQTTGGADVLVRTSGATGPEPAALLAQWYPDYATFSFANAIVLPPLGNGGFTATLDQLGVTTSPTVTTVRVASSHTDTDVAPASMFEPLPLSVAFSTIAPPLPPPAVPAFPVVPPAVVAPPIAVAPPLPVIATPKPCVVPSLKRLRTATAKVTIRRAGCKVGSTRRAYSSTVRSGRVVVSSPRAGTTSAKPVVLVISRGRKPAKRKKTHRAAER